MYESVLDGKRLSLLKALSELQNLDIFYLAGGTALSLQLGLRVSVDFDFFTQKNFNSDALYDAIKTHFPSAKGIDIEPDTCDLLIDNVQVSFFRYPYPLVEAPVHGDGILNHIRIAGPDDIAAMKLSAIGSRGARKDFYDLYQIYHRVSGFDTGRMLNALRTKFGPDLDLTYMLMGLSYFDDAEKEELPKTFVSADWNDIKAFFIQEQSRLFGEVETRIRKELT